MVKFDLAMIIIACLLVLFSFEVKVRKVGRKAKREIGEIHVYHHLKLFHLVQNVSKF